LFHRLADPVLLDALRLSLLTSVTATLVVGALGLPIAYLLATRDFPGKRLLEVLIDLPMVLPPTVAGVGLLLAFGRNGLLGGVLSEAGISVPFTTLAVVLAQVFVAAPFFISATRAGLSEVDRRYLDAAATLRASPARTLMRVMLPLAFPSLLAGAAMTWARALGEFGATITFAGNMPGVTQTMPLAVYIALQSDLDAAVALSVLLLALALGVLLAIRIAAPGLTPFSRRARPTRR
jgi:molybdate transport system permease protein